MLCLLFTVKSPVPDHELRNARVSIIISGLTIKKQIYKQVSNFMSNLIKPINGFSPLSSKR